MPIAEQHVLFFGGLVRGAIAWAQVRYCILFGPFIDICYFMIALGPIFTSPKKMLDKILLRKVSGLTRDGMAGPVTLDIKLRAFFCYILD